MQFGQRVRRRMWWLRSGQAMLAAAAGALALGLTAAAEGLPILPLATCGAVSMAALVFAVARPWRILESAIDPHGDVDGLLRTALGTGLPEQTRRKLQAQAAARSLPLRALPDWQAWALLLGLASAGSGWVLLEPAPMAEIQALSLTGPLFQETEASADGPAPAASPPQPPIDQGIHDSSLVEDGGTRPDTEQWQSAAASDDGSTIGLGLDLGLDQQVYERFLRNRSKHP